MSDVFASMPREAVARECREELGVDVAVGRLLVMDWVPPRRLSDFMFRRMEAALEAIANGSVAELQNGFVTNSEVR